MSDFRLQVFVKVGKHLNLTQAAQELGVSQPAVSKHIQELENQYGVTLLDHSASRMALTPAGKLFLIHAEEILDQYGALEAEMFRIAGNYCGEIRISADSPIIDNKLFSMFLTFCKRHPCIKATFVDANNKSFQELLRNNEVDLAFTNGPFEEKELHFTHYLTQEWAFIARADGVFARKHRVSIEELASYKLNINILKTNKEFYYNILLNDNAFVTHFTEIETIKALIYKGDSVGLLPLFAVQDEITDGTLKILDVDGVIFDEEIGMVTREGENNHAVRWFLEFAQQYNASL